MAEEAEVCDGDDVISNLVRFGTTALPGSFPYPIPGRDGSVRTGQRLINWGCNVPVAADVLGEFLVDRDGTRQAGTIPPGGMRIEHEHRLTALAREFLPPLYADIVAKSDDTLVQAIYSVSVLAYHRGRICLTGDAGSLAAPFTGSLAPPFTGSGIFKAATNAIRLRRRSTPIPMSVPRSPPGTPLRRRARAGSHSLVDNTRMRSSPTRLTSRRWRRLTPMHGGPGRCSIPTALPSRTMGLQRASRRPTLPGLQRLAPGRPAGER